MNPEGADLDVLRRRAKKQLRARARALRAAIPPPALGARSRRIVDRLLELAELQSAGGVALFWPMHARGEVDLRPLHGLLRRDSKRVFYPFMATAGRAANGFAQVDDERTLAERGNGFLEPPDDAPSARRTELDVVVVPALAVVADGHRLGYGAGFYDALLPEFRPPAVAIAVAYDFELLAELPTTANDVACDIVVTDQRTFRVR